MMTILVPTTAWQVREFLGTAGFCRLWIPGFTILAAPLYPLTKEQGKFTWNSEHQKAFDTIKKALLSAPALALPDVTKLFTLYIDERNGVAGVGDIDSNFMTLEEAYSLSFQKIGPSGQWLAHLSESYSCSGPPGEGC